MQSSSEKTGQMLLCASHLREERLIKKPSLVGAAALTAAPLAQRACPDHQGNPGCLSQSDR